MPVMNIVHISQDDEFDHIDQHNRSQLIYNVFIF